MIKARNISPACGSRYYVVHDQIASGTAATNNGNLLGLFPFSQKEPFLQGSTLPGAHAKIFDVLLDMPVLPTGATAVSFNVKKNGTTIFATNGAFATTVGVLDVRGEIALVAGATRPVFSATLSTLFVKKGDVFTCDLALTGTVTVSATVDVAIVVDLAGYQAGTPNY